MFISAFAALLIGQELQQRPIRTEIIQPIHADSFNKGGTAKRRIQGGGEAEEQDGLLVFHGSEDGNRQVDPQIAVGGDYVLHATNMGLVIYTRDGEYVDGVPQSEFNGGIDPKLLFQTEARSFIFDLWNPWDEKKEKPVNVSVSATDDPAGAWNTYPVPAPQGVDGGAVGASRKWIGYSFPGGDSRTFVMSLSDARAGKPVTVHHFAGSLGAPVNVLDPIDDMVFLALTDDEMVITTVGDGPEVKSVVRVKHKIKDFQWPPASPMKDTTKTTASGDRNPKNIVLYHDCLWFSQTLNIGGRAGVRWHQVKLDGSFVQSGLIADEDSSFIQTSLAVNKDEDVLVGFQETSPDMYISGRFAWRRKGDAKGSTRDIVNLEEGLAPTEGGSWGDYSGSCVDGDNMTDLWTIQSFANAKGRGSTVIARFRPPTEAASRRR